MRPISEAPKDRPVLVYVWGGWHIARWDEDRYAKTPRPFWNLRDLGIATSRAHPPTRFVDLPDPPENPDP